MKRMQLNWKRSLAAFGLLAAFNGSDVSAAPAGSGAEFAAVQRGRQYGRSAASAPGLISRWSAEGNAADATGRNNGTLENGATCAPGKVGQAFNLNGDSQYVDVPESPSLNPAKTVSVTAWIYPRQPLNSLAAPVLKKAGGVGPYGQDGGYALELYGTKQVRFGVFLDGNSTWYLSDAAPLPTDEWSFVAGVYDGHAVSFYLNGELVGTPLPASGKIVVSPNNLQIGHDPSNPDRFFNGLIDEASVYRSPLTGEQIRALDKAGGGTLRAAYGEAATPATPARPPGYTARPRGMVSWWQAEGNAKDAIGSNKGILRNGVTFAPGKVGEAFSFDREYHQCVRIPYSTSLIASNYSVEAWVKPTTQVEDMINQNLIFGQGIGLVQLVVRPGDPGVRVVFLFGTDKYTFYEVPGESEIPIGEFSHLVGTWDGTQLRLYLNGKLEGESPPAAEMRPVRFGPPTAENSSRPPAPVDSGCDFFIGGFLTTGTGYCDGEGQFFSGLIDEATFYQRALSAAEVQAHYQAANAGHSPSR